jgi:DNA-binding CsgD family transcriptional regulator
MGISVRHIVLTASNLNDFIAELNSKKTFDSVWQLVCKFFADHGLPWVCYGYSNLVVGLENSVPTFRSTIREDFVKRWFEEGLYAEDPAVRHTLSFLHGKVFGAEFITKNQTTKAVWEFYNDMRSIDSNSVIVMPIRNNPRMATGFFEIGGAFKTKEMKKYLVDNKDRITLAIHYADHRLVELTKAEDAFDSGLTVREKQCLQWLAKGLHNQGIATKLGISLPTVKLHLLNARNKLKASTREQALVRAVNFGLIEP